jgi:sialidase-1
MGGIPNEDGRDQQNFYHQWLYFQTSNDEGENWSKPARINTGNMIGVPHVDTLLQLKSGRLLIPVRRGYRVNSQIHNASGRRGILAGTERKLGGHTHYPEMDITFCYLSDDNGNTWYKFDGYIFGWREKGYGGVWPCDEPVAVELKDDRVMMLMRSTIGRLLKSISEDGGYRWSIPEPSDLVSAYAPCMVRRIPETGDLICVWNQVSPEEMKQGYERSRLSCAISQDDGENWTHFKTIASVIVPPVGRIEAPVGHMRPPARLAG